MRTVSSRRWIPETFYGFPVTGSTVLKAETAMALTEKGLCAFHGAPVNEDGWCETCRKGE